MAKQRTINRRALLRSGKRERIGRPPSSPEAVSIDIKARRALKLMTVDEIMALGRKQMAADKKEAPANRG
jgi:hypothetical protein